MFKKLLLPVALLFVAFPLFSQTIVNTDPENRKAILEEFTGINCQFCPQGHAIANAIKANNPDDFFVINIHQGGFANPGAGQPDFRTPFGNAIVNQSYSGGGFGYPSGTVNRQNFPGREMTAPGTTAMSRSFWTVSSNETIAQSSYVNVGVEAEIDINTRELTVHVEAYYTGNSPQSTNKLNVALLQNNTLGPQSGGNMGNNYVHMHRLVHLLTGQWGVDINTTTTGSFVDETFTYTIPADYNGVPVDFFEAELELVVFITETQQNIISGNGAFATYTGLANANDIRINEIGEIMNQCNDVITPTIKVQNVGSNDATSLTIEYSVNGGAVQSYEWNGELNSVSSQTIELPEIQYNLQANNTLVVTIENDDDNSNNEMTLNFDEAVESNYELDLTIQTDNWGSEVRWNIKNPEGQTIIQGGPYGNNQTINVEIELPNNCFTFNLIDTFGDGGGPVSLADSDGLIIYSTNGNYGSGESENFSVSNSPLSLNENDEMAVLIYPNPTSGILNVQTKNNLNITIFDLTGKQVFNTTDVSNGNQIDLSALNTGLYLVKMNDGINNSTQKLIIK
ncbi:MAG: T9SS type A sorting domain-containing protein [Flavobacteriaceae bacterium]|nr:T9SS type A sorting domain-containing protein [Flavobacteriaceae bacterium]